MATYREAVAEGGALGGSAVDRSRQAACQAHLGLDGADGLLGAKALVKAHREPARCHGHDVREKGRDGSDGRCIWRCCSSNVKSSNSSFIVWSGPERAMTLRQPITRDAYSTSLSRGRNSAYPRARRETQRQRRSAFIHSRLSPLHPYHAHSHHGCLPPPDPDAPGAGRTRAAHPHFRRPACLPCAEEPTHPQGYPESDLPDQRRAPDSPASSSGHQGRCQ